MEGFLGVNLASNFVPSSSNDINRGLGRVSHKGNI